MDKSEPVPPVSDATASPPDGPKTVSGWFAANLLPLAFVAAVIALIVWRELDILPVILAVLGLGLVIFIHELGHFVAAKLCDVHVETFSIGFGKAIPGCQFRYGETTYKIGWIPLGGYVKMVGEGENADSEEADEDPRSFKNKSVWQRMVIISAGVVMNLILGCICFMAAYSVGVEETPATVGAVAVGSPAWEQGVRIGDQVTQIDRVSRPTFDDIRPTVMSASKDESIPFTLEDRSGSARSIEIVPRRNPEDLYPLVGINPIDQLVLQKARKGGTRPVRRNSPAAKARAAEDGSEFQGGDRIVAASHDPARPADLKELGVDPRDPTNRKRDTFEFLRYQYQMRGKEMTVRVERDGKPFTFTIPPAYTQVVPGVRFQMGRLASLRVNGPAATAVVVVPAAEEGLQTTNLEAPGSGDKIIAVEVAGPDGRIRYVEEPSPEPEAGVTERQFDPARLGYELEQWAEKAVDHTVRLTVLRAATGPVKKGRRVTFALKWDPALVFNGETVLAASAPLPISGLGLAYFVDTTVDAVAPNSPAGLVKGDVVTEVRLREVNDKGESITGEWLPVKQHQGAYLHALLQIAPVAELDLKVERAGAGPTEVTVTTQPDSTWPAIERGLRFPPDSRLQKAEDPWDALGMGMHRTWRTVKVIYQTLYATIFRQISAKTMSGPLSIANASYRIAEYDFWQFVIFIGLININLAVVNFLPIPLLDGGHMMFLIYEKVRGKPPPDKLVEWSLWVGLAFILSLMVFVIFLDVRKLFF